MIIAKVLLKRIISFFVPTLYNEGLVVLNYHSVHPSHHYSMTPDLFDKQMSWLAAREHVVGRVEDAVPGKRSVMITFDDGFEDNVTHALPILQKYGLIATFFLTTDFVSGRRDITKEWVPYNGLPAMTIDQVRVLQASGMHIGSHGVSHANMGKMCVEEVREELSESKKELESWIGRSISVFAFPFGQKKDQGEQRDVLIEEAKYNYAFTTDWGINILPMINPFRIKRIRIDEYDSIRDLQAKIAGKWQFVAWVQQWKQRM